MLSDIFESISDYKSKSDFFRAIFDLTHIIDNVGDDYSIFLSKNFHFNIINKVLINDSFNNALSSILTKNGNDNRDALELINASLRLSTVVLSRVICYIPDNSIAYFNQKIRKDLSFVKYLQRQRGILCNQADIYSSLFNAIYNSDYDYKEDCNDYINFELYLDNFNSSKWIMSSILYILHQENVIKGVFKDCVRKKNELGDRFSPTKALFIINNQVRLINNIISAYSSKKRIDFEKFVSKFNLDSNIKIANFIIQKMTDGFKFEDEINLINKMREKVRDVSSIQNEIDDFAKENLMAYCNKYSNFGSEWANKIYITTKKSLGGISALDGAINYRWLKNVFNRELYHWIDEVHMILNKYEIEDDWEKISDLVQQENNKVEWKSSFYTSTEKQHFNENAEKSEQKRILSNIISPMLGMMNTDGGTILVGLVENPRSIVREYVKKNIIKKHKISFFNIDYEFSKVGKNLDKVKQDIQDQLYSETQRMYDEFNDLWTIEPIRIKNDNNVVIIYKINIYKSDNFIYNYKKEGGYEWVGLTRRADGRTIKVDPRNYILPTIDIDN